MTQANENPQSLAPKEGGAFDHKRRKPRNVRMLRLRNALNIVFMAMAAVGVAIYLTADRQRGIMVVLVAMGVKLVESAIRMQTKLTEDK